MTDERTELVWVRSMGQRMLVRATPEDAAQMRRGAAKMRALKAATTRKARAALAAYLSGAGTLGAAVDAISRRTMFCGSHERLWVMLLRTADAPREVFWPVFLKHWGNCDATWQSQDILLAVLRRHAPEILPDDRQRIIDALPGRVRVFRGCSRERIKGVSWTTDRAIAEGFAHGHRFIPVPDPVVATAMIDKGGIFLIDNDRNEHEAILDPGPCKSCQSARCGSDEGPARPCGADYGRATAQNRSGSRGQICRPIG